MLALLFAALVATRSHVTINRTIHLAASPSAIFPLFGPFGEKRWAGKSWQPHAIATAEELDREGLVFRDAADSDATWVTSRFDENAHVVQYVIFRPDLVAQIRIEVMADGTGSAAKIAYDLTALTEAGDTIVEHHGKAIEGHLVSWEHFINAALEKHQAPASGHPR